MSLVFLIVYVFLKLYLLVDFLCIKEHHSDFGGIVVEIDFANKEVDLEYFGHDAYVIFEIVIKGSSWGTVIISSSTSVGLKALVALANILMINCMLRS